LILHLEFLLIIQLLNLYGYGKRLPCVLIRLDQHLLL
jgi:hypothetical protein